MSSQPQSEPPPPPGRRSPPPVSSSSSSSLETEISSLIRVRNRLSSTDTMSLPKVLMALLPKILRRIDKNEYRVKELGGRTLTKKKNGINVDGGEIERMDIEEEEEDGVVERRTQRVTREEEEELKFRYRIHSELDGIVEHTKERIRGGLVVVVAHLSAPPSPTCQDAATPDTTPSCTLWMKTGGEYVSSRCSSTPFADEADDVDDGTAAAAAVGGSASSRLGLSYALDLIELGLSHLCAPPPLLPNDMTSVRSCLCGGLKAVEYLHHQLLVHQGKKAEYLEDWHRASWVVLDAISIVGGMRPLVPSVSSSSSEEYGHMRRGEVEHHHRQQQLNGIIPPHDDLSVPLATTEEIQSIYTTTGGGGGGGGVFQLFLDVLLYYPDTSHLSLSPSSRNRIEYRLSKLLVHVSHADLVTYYTQVKLIVLRYGVWPMNRGLFQKGKIAGDNEEEVDERALALVVLMGNNNAGKNRAGQGKIGRLGVTYYNAYVGKDQLLSKDVNGSVIGIIGSSSATKKKKKKKTKKSGGTKEMHRDATTGSSGLCSIRLASALLILTLGDDAASEVLLSRQHGHKNNNSGGRNKRWGWESILGPLPLTTETMDETRSRCCVLQRAPLSPRASSAAIDFINRFYFFPSSNDHSDSSVNGMRTHIQSSAHTFFHNTPLLPYRNDDEIELFVTLSLKTIRHGLGSTWGTTTTHRANNVRRWRTGVGAASGGAAVEGPSIERRMELLRRICDQLLVVGSAPQVTTAVAKSEGIVVVPEKKKKGSADPDWVDDARKECLSIAIQVLSAVISAASRGDGTEQPQQPEFGRRRRGVAVGGHHQQQQQQLHEFDDDFVMDDVDDEEEEENQNDEEEEQRRGDDNDAAMIDVQQQRRVLERRDVLRDLPFARRHHRMMGGGGNHAMMMMGGGGWDMMGGGGGSSSSMPPPEARVGCYQVIRSLAEIGIYSLRETDEVTLMKDNEAGGDSVGFEGGGKVPPPSFDLPILLLKCLAHEDKILAVNAIGALDALLVIYRDKLRKMEKKLAQASSPQLCSSASFSPSPHDDDDELRLHARQHQVAPLLPPLLTASCSDIEMARSASVRWATDIVNLLDPIAALHLCQYLSTDPDGTTRKVALEGIAKIERDCSSSRKKGGMAAAAGGGQLASSIAPAIEFVDTAYDSSELILQYKLNDMIQSVSTQLNLPVSISAVLLRSYQYRANELFDAYQTDPGLTLERCGVMARSKQTTRSDPPSEQQNQTMPSGNSAGKGGRSDHTCEICFDDTFHIDEMYGMPCGHSFCRLCWKSYIEVQLGEGQVARSAVVDATCPDAQCNERMTDVDVQEIAPDLYQLWNKYMIKSYMDGAPYHRWCPGKDCTMLAILSSSPPRAATTNSNSSVGAIHSGTTPTTTMVTRATCQSCSTTFCFHCGSTTESHLPATCTELTQWRSIVSSSDLWIAKHAKPCPNCNVPVDKAGGCNHMHCSRCNSHFCWICLTLYSVDNMEHNCNRYDPAEHMNDDEGKKIFFTSRYQAHHDAEKMARRQLRVLDKVDCIDELMDSPFYLEYDDINVLKRAIETVSEARRFLKYTYVIAYFLSSSSSSSPAPKDGEDDTTTTTTKQQRLLDTKKKKQQQKEMFENHQGTLELFTEKLSQLTEMNINKLRMVGGERYVRMHFRTVTFHDVSVRGYIERMLTFVEEGRRTLL